MLLYNRKWPRQTTWYWNKQHAQIHILLQKQKRSTEGCSKFKSPETRQVQERLVSAIHVEIYPNLRFFGVKCDNSLINTQIGMHRLQDFICMEHNARNINVSKEGKMSIFWLSFTVRVTFNISKFWNVLEFGDGSRRFRSILAYQRQVLDIQQSRFAGRNLSCLDVTWMKRSSSWVSFFSVYPISGGLQPILFAETDWLFSNQLF